MDPIAHRVTATPLSGGKIELTVPGLAPDETVEVIVRRFDGDWDGYDEQHETVAGPGLSSEAVDEVFLLERQAWEG